MPKHKLILDDTFNETRYTLIAIHCEAEDYRLAYLLNKFLSIRLSRKAVDLDFKNGQTSYAIYEWQDKNELITWSLVSNIYKKSQLQKVDKPSLFDNQEKITKVFQLLPEYQTVNYFLKIDSKFSFIKSENVLERILKTPRIITAYSLDPSILKSKDNLIFN